MVVLVERACKAEELCKEKRKADFEARYIRKKSPVRAFHSDSMKFLDDRNCSKTDVRYSNRDRARLHSNSRAPVTSATSVGIVRSKKSECKHYGKRHLGNCRLNVRACFRCRSLDHFVRDCSEPVE